MYAFGNGADDGFVSVLFGELFDVLSQLFLPVSRLGHVDHIRYEYLPALEGRHLEISFDRILSAVLSTVYSFELYFFAVAGNKWFDYTEEVRREIPVDAGRIYIEHLLGCISEVQSGAFVHLEKLISLGIDHIDLVQGFF